MGARVLAMHEPNEDYHYAFTPLVLARPAAE